MDSATTGMKKDLPEPEVQENSLAEEMKKLPKVRTSILTEEEEKCTTMNEHEVGIACPRPRRLVVRTDEELHEQKFTDLPDLLVPTDTPPYFSGSPPPRCSNSHFRDALFFRQF